MRRRSSSVSLLGKGTTVRSSSCSVIGTSSPTTQQDGCREPGPEPGCYGGLARKKRGVSAFVRRAYRTSGRGAPPRIWRSVLAFGSQPFWHRPSRPKPFQDGIHIRQPQPGCRGSRPHLDGGPAQPVYHRKSELIRHVVADEQRRQTAEGRFAHERPYRGALVATGGGQLDDALPAVNDVAIAEARLQGAHRAMRHTRQSRIATIVQRDRQPLVFDQQCSMARRERRQGLSGGIESM